MDKEKLQEWKQILLQEIKNLQTQLAPMEIELKVRREKLAAIDRLLNLETHPVEAISTSQNSSSTIVMDKRKISDIAYDVLKDAGVSMHYRDLCEAILQRGFEIRGKDPAINLIAHISSDSRFKRIKRGTYALKEWKSAQKHIKPKGRGGRNK